MFVVLDKNFDPIENASSLDRVAKVILNHSGSSFKIKKSVIKSGKKRGFRYQLYLMVFCFGWAKKPHCSENWDEEEDELAEASLLKRWLKQSYRPYAIENEHAITWARVQEYGVGSWKSCPLN